MTTIKSYTDINQSKKLAKILPLESADMYYMNGTKHVLVIPNYETDFFHLQEDDIPSWSLSALLEQIPYELCDDDGNSYYLQIYKDDDLYQLEYKDHSLYGDFESIETDRYEHFVDACVELILKLNELNLL